jgi:hypothetical protein
MDYFGVLALHFINALLCEDNIAQFVRLRHYMFKEFGVSTFRILFAEQLIGLEGVMH